jgi:hypothetical protein
MQTLLWMPRQVKRFFAFCAHLVLPQFITAATLQMYEKLRLEIAERRFQRRNSLEWLHLFFAPGQKPAASKASRFTICGRARWAIRVLVCNINLLFTRSAS